MADERRSLSRFQVRCEGRPAWALGVRERRYYFDGLRFWALGSRSGRVTAAWQVPGHGWVHEHDCRCSLCADGAGGALPQVA
jgi:hypothetical protein